MKNFQLFWGMESSELTLTNRNNVIFSKRIYVCQKLLMQILMRYLQRQYSLNIALEDVELKINNFDICNTNDVRKYELKGYDLVIGSNKSVEISSDEILSIFEPHLSYIKYEIFGVLQDIKPDLAIELADMHLYINGYCNFKNIEKYLDLPIQVINMCFN